MAPHLTPAQKWVVELAAKDIVEKQQSEKASCGLIAMSLKNLQATGIDVEASKLRDALKYKVKALKAKRNTASNVPASVTVSETTEYSSVTNSPPASQNSTVSTRRPGRPVGTTKKAKSDLETLIKVAKNTIAVKYKDVSDSYRLETNQRVPRGCLNSIIDETKRELGLPDDVKINSSTIKGRFRRSAKSLTLVPYRSQHQTLRNPQRFSTYTNHPDVH